MAAILGVDVGGTFTDFLLWEDSRLTLHKRPSTPSDPAEGVLQGLTEMGCRPEGVVHGSTIATNALLERKGVTTALITTRGFRDVLAIGRQTRPKLYDLSPQRPPPLVSEDLRLEINERLDHTGQILTPLDASEVDVLLDRLAQAGVESLAVCLLFSFLNPEHERAIAQRARERGFHVSASCEVLPEYREYERTSTTVINAYVAPVMGRYLERLEERLGSQGVARLAIMQSGGGSMSPRAAGRQAVRTILSGPAGGVVGAFYLASRAAFPQIITLDMGGTSTDVSLCPGRIPERTDTAVGDLPIATPAVDVVSVGAGGGSIARLDEGGAMHVGPESAGADPGPACYGKALLPTVTDAHVVLGRLLPEHFLGGRLPLHIDRARQALSSIAAPFDGDLVRAAASVVRVANANMERAIRLVSVERGYDPRLFTLVAFGGAGPLHACDLAEALRIPRVLVPPFPGILSAFGMVTAEPTRDFSRAVMRAIPPEPGDESHLVENELEQAFRELADGGREEMAAEGFDAPRLAERRFLDMRYLGQSYELTLPVDSLSPERFLPTFHALHQERYSHSNPARATEVVNVRLKLVGPGQEPVLAPLPEGGSDASQALVDRRAVWFGEETSAAIYERERLRAGNRIEEPAIVVQMDSTTVIPPGWEALVDGVGNLVVKAVER
jgi:N-methylhydantoinase A